MRSHIGCAPLELSDFADPGLAWALMPAGLRSAATCRVLSRVPRPTIMATVFKSHGTVGPGSMDGGQWIPLDVIDKRLKDFRIFCHGERPKTMLPQSREYYTHVMIQVTDDDPEPRPDRFPRVAFYQVVGLRPRDAGFLFEPC